MARTPSEYAVHIMLEGGHREEVRFSTIQDFQKWYSSELVPKSAQDHTGRIYGSAAFAGGGATRRASVLWQR